MAGHHADKFVPRITALIVTLITMGDAARMCLLLDEIRRLEKEAHVLHKTNADRQKHCARYRREVADLPVVVVNASHRIMSVLTLCMLLLFPWDGAVAQEKVGR